jgi:hypothetical protein
MMATKAEQLILRGLHMLVRLNFAPNDEARAAKQYAALAQDIGPWMTDYVEEIAKPASDEAPSASYDGGEIHQH